VNDSPKGRVRTVAIALGAVVVFQLLMVGSYVGAFHNPTPRAVPVGVVGPTPAVAQQAIASIPNSSGALSLTVVADDAIAQRRILDGDLYAAFVLGATADQLYVASAASPSIADAVSRDFTAAEAAAGRTLSVIDVAALPASDSRGVAPFYLVLGWVVGGYLGATVVGLLRGMGAAGRRNAWRRVAALAAFALVSGVAITVATAATFGIVSDHLISVALLGSLVVFATAVATAGLQAIFGIAGTGIVLLLFVVFGNPASGGPAVRPLLPTLWRRLGGAVVNGAGTDALRAAIYFPTRSILAPVLILFGWALAGVTAMVVVGHGRTADPFAELELEAGVAAI